MIRVICAGLFFLTLPRVGFAFKTDSLISKDTACANYFYSGLSFISYNKLHLSNEGVSHAFSKRLPTAEINLGYRNKPGKFLGWSVDLSVGIIPISIGYNFAAPDSSVFQKNNPEKLVFDQHNREYIIPNLYFSVAPAVNGYIPLKPKTEIYFSLGCKLYWFYYDQADINLGTGIYIDSNNTNLVNLFSTTIRDTTNNEINIGLKAESGIRFKLSDQRYLQLNAVLNLSPKQRLHGWYSFTNLGYLSQGTLSQGINYLGLSLEYGFPVRSRRRN
ncbi:MAG: hypothetical protein HYZ14_12975 [Bacteroidetes bacterium]|nr:hypothetical protein [Bacteroidota bacterium]